MMKRRSFLATGAALGILPSGLSALAQNTKKTVILVHARGGWDPPWFIEPKDPTSGIFLDYTSSQIRTVSGTEISYVDRSTILTDFFEQHAQRLVVLHGVDMETNMHDVGNQVSVCGSKQNYPTAMALQAYVRDPFAPISHWTNNPYKNTDSLVPLVSINKEEDFTNILGGFSPLTPRTFEPRLIDKLKEMRKRRYEQLTKSLANPDLRIQLENLYSLRQQGVNDADLEQYYKSFPPLTGNETPRQVEVKWRVRVALIGHMIGVTHGVCLDVSGFDSHDDMRDHIGALETYFMGMDYLWQSIKAFGLEDEIIVAMSTDFGRQPVPQDPGKDNPGKDHHPITSLIFMGASIGGGKVYGGTDNELNPKKINPQTLALDDNGVILNYRHFHAIMRRISGVDEHAIANKYPIDAQYIPFLKGV